jgi:mono/diheme cytochrome c family protein
MSMRSRRVKTTVVMAIIAGMVASVTLAAGGPGYRGPFGLGRVPSETEIKARDIAVGPDGTGLPAGRGTVSMGEQVYQAKCVACHGPTATEGPMDKLVGEKLSVKTIGSFGPMPPRCSIISGGRSPLISQDH